MNQRRISQRGSREKTQNLEEFELLAEKHKTSQKRILLHKRTLLLQGDVLYKNTFDKEIFDLIITSPPYNVDLSYNSHKDDLDYEEYLSFSERWMKNCYSWTKKQGRFCLNIPLDKNKGGQKSVGADLTKLAQKIG